jgi:hypothetical protein
MLFHRPLIIESGLSVALTRARLRACASTPYVADLEAFRRRQIIGWRLSEANENFLFQPEFGDILDIGGARLVALVEPMANGSRIRGRVVVSALTKIVLTLWMFAVMAAMLVALRQGTEAPTRVLGIGALMLGAAVAMARYSLWSASRDIQARLRQRLDSSRADAAA